MIQRVLAWLWQLRRSVAAFGMVGFSTFQLYLAFAFPHPVTISFADFERRKPVLGWYRVTDVPLDYDRAVWKTPLRDQQRYIPAVDAHGKIPLLVEAYTDDESTARGGRTVKTVTGTLDVWLNGGTADRSANVAPMSADLDDDYRTLVENTKPAVGLALVLGIGIAAALGLGKARTTRQPSRARSVRHSPTRGA